MSKNFNIVIAGVGGQGLMTLLKILSEAAFIEGYDVKTSELHGLSQRGGSIEAHIRFGEKVFSPLVPIAKADLVLGLEMAEALRELKYANKNTAFLVNRHYISFFGSLPEKEIIEKLVSSVKNLFLAPASEICRLEFGTDVVSAVYLLGAAFAKKLIPLKKESILRAVKKIIPEKYFELNKKAFELAKTRINAD